jgi:hypothetical protein
MKKLMLILIFGLILMTSFTSCSKDDEYDNSFETTCLYELAKYDLMNNLRIYRIGVWNNATTFEAYIDDPDFYINNRESYDILCNYSGDYIEYNKDGNGTCVVIKCIHKDKVDLSLFDPEVLAPINRNWPL